jgi:catechol 2,3-dioxygenase-like lactoylglutathione lyase family enzyme
MIKPRRIGHATFESPDVQRMIDYYTGTIGLVLAEREKNRAFLATKIGQLAVEVNKGDVERCSKLSFEVAPNCDFSELARELEKDGIRGELRNDSTPGIGPVLSFQDGKGTTIELFKDWSSLGKNDQAAGIGPLKLGHVAWVVQDPQATAKFYEKVLGFRVSDWIGDFFVFMRCNPDHHTVNFIKGKNTKMHHIAYELKDFVHLQNACELFGQRQIPIIWGPVRLGPGHNVAVFHRTPDDQVVELYAELDQMKDEELGYFEPRPWHRDIPQRPKVWDPKRSTIWGTPPAPDFFRARD